MVKAKDFLLHLCEVCNYRFFSGKSVNALDELKAHMSTDLLHYMPAVSTKNAFGLSLGVSLTGFNSIVILDISDLPLLYNYLKDIQTMYKQPLLLLVGYRTNEELSEYKKLTKGTKSLILDSSYKEQLKKHKNALRLAFIQEGFLE